MSANLRDPGFWLMVSTGVQYAAAMVVFAMTQRPALAVMYLGYTIGNVGAAMIAMGSR